MKFKQSFLTTHDYHKYFKEQDVLVEIRVNPQDKLGVLRIVIHSKHSWFFWMFKFKKILKHLDKYKMLTVEHEIFRKVL